MGKIPGNLCIEQLMDFLNVEYNRKYYLEVVCDAIDDYIMPIYEKQRWGYSIPYALSAQCGVHRTYAKYLINKERLHTKEIRRLLQAIDDEHSELFDSEYVEKLYRGYMLTDCNSDFSSIKMAFDNYEQFVIIAPGKSIANYDFDKSMLNQSCVITIIFIIEDMKTDFCFYEYKKIRVCNTN